MTDERYDENACGLNLFIHTFLSYVVRGRNTVSSFGCIVIPPDYVSFRHRRLDFRRERGRVGDDDHPRGAEAVAARIYSRIYSSTLTL